MKRLFVVAATLLVALALSANVVAAASKAGMNVSFFAGGGGSPGWSRTMSNSDDPFSMKLNVPDPSAFAGIYLHRTASTLPSGEPGFDQYQTGTVSGPVRLVIAATDGCYAMKYVYPFVTDAWATANQWDRMGSCGYGYNVSWASIQTTFASRTVSSVYVVSDSYNGGSVTWVDNLSYDGQTFSQPSDNGK